MKIAYTQIESFHDSWPFTCFLTQMYTSMKSKFFWPFLDNLPPKGVPSTLLYYIWKMAYNKWKACTMSQPFTRRLTQMYSSMKSGFSTSFFWTICQINASLVICSITFGRLQIHNWKVCMISLPFTCCLTQMYSMIRNEFPRPFFWQFAT